MYDQDEKEKTLQLVIDGVQVFIRFNKPEGKDVLEDIKISLQRIYERIIRESMDSAEGE